LTSLHIFYVFKCGKTGSFRREAKINKKIINKNKTKFKIFKNSKQTDFAVYFPDFKFLNSSSVEREAKLYIRTIYLLRHIWEKMREEAYFPDFIFKILPENFFCKDLSF